MEPMMTQERLAALTAVSKGTVKVKRIAAPGHPFKVEPREMTVAFGFLRKAQLIGVDEYDEPYVTTRGKQVLK